MTTTDSSFVAEGPANIGLYANTLPRRARPFRIAVQGWGHQAGICGATDEVGGIALQPWSYAGVVGMSNDHYGITGFSTLNTGVWGYSGDGAGVRGESPNSNGVEGYSPAVVGVYGDCPIGAGVSGNSSSGVGVLGRSATGSAVRGAAGFLGPAIPHPVDIAGVVGSSDARHGVIGASNALMGLYGFSTDNAGVVGVAGAQGPVPALVNIAGVVGSSDQQTGVIGTSNGIGVYGYCGNADPAKSGIGVYGRAGRAPPNNYAGAFDGNVSITGDLTLLGTANVNVKNAIVPFPDGTHRVLHCMESPEHWFEDFGTANLKRGRAVVKLDADFAKVIKRGDYKVFLTPEGDCRGLYVRKSAASFEVRELGGGTSSIAFSYRIVGRRKDIKNHRRFAKIDVKPNLEKLFAEMRKRMAKPARRRRRRRGKRA